MLYQTAGSQGGFRSDGSCEGGQLSLNWYDWYAEFILGISTPPSPNTAFGSTSESQFCDHGWGHKPVLVSFMMPRNQEHPATNLHFEVFRISSSFCHTDHGACMCPAACSGTHFGSPVQPWHLGEQSITSLGWRTVAVPHLCEHIPHSSWLRVLWPSHSVFLQLLQHYFFSPLNFFFGCFFSFYIYRWTKEEEITKKETGLTRKGEEQRQR